jgi:hypothetical protein
MQALTWHPMGPVKLCGGLLCKASVVVQTMLQKQRNLITPLLLETDKHCIGWTPADWAFQVLTKHSAARHISPSRVQASQNPRYRVSNRISPSIDSSQSEASLPLVSPINTLGNSRASSISWTLIANNFMIIYYLLKKNNYVIYST